MAKPPLTNSPGWIELLYQRGNASHSLQTSFLLNLSNKLVAELADAQSDGCQQLRAVALAGLLADDEETVSLSLLFLGVVGTADDLAQIDPFQNHPSNLICRAAKTCSFEIRQASRV